MNAANENRLHVRVTALEEMLTHFERGMAELNGVVLTQQQQIERLEARLARLSVGLDTLRETLPTPPPDAVADRPPHY